MEFSLADRKLTWTGDELELNENLESVSSKSDVEYRPKFFMNESFSCCWLMCWEALKTRDNFVASDRSKGLIAVENMHGFSRGSSSISLGMNRKLACNSIEIYRKSSIMRGRKGWKQMAEAEIIMRKRDQCQSVLQKPGLSCHHWLVIASEHQRDLRGSKSSTSSKPCCLFRRTKSLQKHQKAPESKRGKSSFLYKIIYKASKSIIIWLVTFTEGIKNILYKNLALRIALLSWLAPSRPTTNQATKAC